MKGVISTPWKMHWLLLFLVKHWACKDLLGSCWGHAMSKCDQYATNDAKVFTRLTSVSIKEV
jgi:hypothetical protein